MFDNRFKTSANHVVVTRELLLPYALYGVEIWSYGLTEDNSLRASERLLTNVWTEGR